MHVTSASMQSISYIRICRPMDSAMTSSCHVTLKALFGGDQQGVRDATSFTLDEQLLYRK